MIIKCDVLTVQRQRSLNPNVVEESKEAEVAGGTNPDAVHSIRVAAGKTNSNVLLRTFPQGCRRHSRAVAMTGVVTM